MIVTVTLNPALDKTAWVDRLRPASLNRLSNITVDAGGKGVNVSAVIRELGGESVATGFAGGGAGGELLSRIDAMGIRADFAPIAGSTRTNLKVVDERGELTELNEPGPDVSGDEWRTLEKKLLGYAKAGTIFALSGSVPPSLDADVYAKLCALLKGAGASVFLDADGEAFRAALDGESVPDFIKPNRYEVLQYFGLPDSESSDADLVGYCEQFLAKGCKTVALSLGAAGALFADAGGVWRASALTVDVRSTVGAGDSMCAALLYGTERGMDAESRYALAVAVSAAACATAGTKPPPRGLIDSMVSQVVMRKI
jgi:1-phosphofructokinase